MHGMLSEDSLGALDRKVVAEVIASSTDIALILNPDGVIHDVSINPSHRNDPRFLGWVGREWIETVASDSRPKVESLLQEVRDDKHVRSREINHRYEGLDDFPVRYSAMALGKEGQILAIGRELGTVANLQQQLMNAQQSMEREYARLRSAETRYRLLFQISSEAVLIIDASNQRVAEANPAALELAMRGRERMDGKPLSAIFDAPSVEIVSELLKSTHTSRTGSAPEVNAKLARGEEDVTVSATVFRQGISAYYLIRLGHRQGRPVASSSGEESRLLEVLESLPDSFVVINDERRVIKANLAFYDLVQVATESQILDQPLDRWIGRPGVDLNIMMANLRDHGSIRNFATVVQGELGVTEQIEISAVAAKNGSEPCFGFIIRAIQATAALDPATSDLPQSVQQITGLVGRVSLKEIVRETTDVIERLCIEAALEVSGGNRASAAQILGLSRQSLYSKLHRHSISRIGSSEEEES